MTVDLVVIGGSGFYVFGEVDDRIEVDTPFGAPSTPLEVCRIGGRRVGFISRHQPGHRLPPHAVPYRANLWAARQVGAQAVVATFACGSLRPDWGPGTMVVPDQLIDQTRRRPDTFFDEFTDGPVHAPFAEPYNPTVRRALLDGAAGTAIDGGTVVVIDGPRFATRAESRSYRTLGADLINMTQYPEAVLAKELELPYGSVGLVTDFDAGLEGHPEVQPVSQETVFATFAANLPRVRQVVVAALALL